MKSQMDVRMWIAGHVESLTQAAKFHQATRVRIGMTGEGIRPNYQLLDKDDKLIAINGINHQPFTRVSEFDTRRVSRIYDVSEIVNMRVWGGVVEMEAPER